MTRPLISVNLTPRAMAVYAAFRWRRLSATLLIGENTVADVCYECQAKDVCIPLARGISKEQKNTPCLG